MIYAVIRRAKQIREAIKEAICFRLAAQGGKLHRELEPTQISTSIDSINEYLVKLTSFILESHPQ